MSDCLRVQNLTKSFGGLVAVNDVAFAVEERSITGLIGPNGSGKTVTFDCITGFYKPDAGRVFFRDREITALRPDAIALHGLARSFQLTGVFPRLTVAQNLVFAAQEKRILRNLRANVRLRDAPDRKDRARIEQVLEFLELERVRDEVAASLPYGQQKTLELGSLMLMNPDPVLYLLDEPFAGLAQGEIARYLSLMNELRQGGKTFLVVEHNMRAIMGSCDYIVVLDHGEKIAEGAPERIQRDARVVEAYLGHGDTAPGP
jgi:branched-chain amino acid transport system ATP-binding protein